MFIFVVQTLTNCAFVYFATVFYCYFVICVSSFKSEQEPTLFQGKHFATKRSVWRIQFKLKNFISPLCCVDMADHRSISLSAFLKGYVSFISKYHFPTSTVRIMEDTLNENKSTLHQSSVTTLRYNQYKVENTIVD